MPATFKMLGSCKTMIFHCKTLQKSDSLLNFRYSNFSDFCSHNPSDNFPHGAQPAHMKTGKYISTAIIFQKSCPADTLLQFAFQRSELCFSEQRYTKSFPSSSLIPVEFPNGFQRHHWLSFPP